MKQSGQIEQKAYTQLERSLRIYKLVKKQFFITSLLFFFALLFLGVGLFPRINTNVEAFCLGLSGNLLVAIIIFLFLEQGIKSLHPISEIRNLPIIEFIDSISKTKHGEHIRILETFTALANEYYKEFTLAVKQAIKNGARIEILLFHPFSEGARKRAQQLEKQTNVKEELQKNLARIYNLQCDLQATLGNQYAKHFNVKLYNALPSIAMYRCGEWAYVSLFPIGARADKCPNLKVPMDSPFGSYIDDTFEEFRDGTDQIPTIPLDLHMRLLIISSTPGSPSPHTGYCFAHEERNGDIDKSKCFVEVDAQTLHFIIDMINEKKKVIFCWENRYWQAVPGLFNLNDAQDSAEYRHAKQLIQQRYEKTLGGNEIIRLQDIEEVSNKVP